MRILFFFLLLISSFSLKPQSLPAIEITEKWLDGIENMVEGRKRLAPNMKKDILIFSLHTGYNHWTIPHTEAAIKRIAEKTVNNELLIDENKFCLIHPYTPTVPGGGGRSG